MPTDVNSSNQEKTVERESSPGSLVILAGPRFGETIPLIKGKNNVGSGANATIRLSTPLLSDHHFTLVYEDQRVILRTEGKAIVVSHRSMEEAVLNDGDLIEAGGVLMRYVDGESKKQFFVGDYFYSFGSERRRYPRFNMIADVDVFIDGESQRLEILSVRDVGRGGTGLFCKDKVLPGTQVVVSIYSKNSDRVIEAESIHGTVINTVPWKDALFLLNIRFHLPVSADYQPILHKRLREMEKYSSGNPMEVSASKMRVHNM